MKKLNEGRFFRVKSETEDSKFHAPVFHGDTQKYSLFPPYCLPSQIPKHEGSV